MLCNALDGSEDVRARGEAARLWQDLRTSDKRAAAVVEVDRSDAAEQLSCGTVAGLVRPFPVRGVLDEYKEGREDEGEPLGGQSCRSCS